MVVLYRRWEDAGGGGVNKCLQLVIPPSTVPSVLSELHDSLSGGHLGVGKVLVKGSGQVLLGWTTS